jgi:hypothetical protein
MELTWEYGSQERSVISLPLCVSSVSKSFNMSLTSDDDLSNAFLYTDGDYVGIVEAKRSEQANYMDVGIYCHTPECFLGTIKADAETIINLRVTFPTGYSGEYSIPVYVGYGDNIKPFVLQETNFSWNDDSIDDPHGWCSTSEEADEYIWIGGTS